jgi:hypothetical protein
MKRFIALLALATACTGDLPLEGRPCPCAEGWTCCESTKLCVASSAECVPVEVVPSSARLRLGASQHFFTAVPGSVSWSVDETHGGSIDPSGRYRAPLRPGTYHVRATTGNGIAATATVVVGPSELSRLLGVPGGRGTADGVGRDARFSNPGSITGDDGILYVTDTPAYDRSYANINVEFSLCCAESIADCLERCSSALQSDPRLEPAGIRRISASTGAVTWLTSASPVRHLASGQGLLFAATSRWVGGCEKSGPYLFCWPELSASTVVVRVDRETGQMIELAGADLTGSWGSPIDGVGAKARFGSIRGMAADDADGLYVTDGSLLRRIAISTGEVTTLPVTESSFAPSGPIAVHGGRAYIVDQETDLSDAYWDSQTIWEYEIATGAIKRLQTHSSKPIGAGVRGLCFGALGWYGVIDRCVGPLLKNHGTGCDFSFAEAPGGIWCADDDRFYLTDSDNALVHWVGQGTDQPVAGELSHDLSGPLSQHMQLSKPTAITSDAHATIVFQTSGRMIRIQSDMQMSEWQVSHAASMAMDHEGQHLYYSFANGIRSIHLETGAVKTVANGSYASMAVDASGTLYASRLDECSIVQVPATTSSGMVTLGNDQCGPMTTGSPGELFVAGAELEILRIDLQSLDIRPLHSPKDGWEATALAYDPAGVLYVAEKDRQRIRGLIVDTGEVFDLAGKLDSQGVQLGPLPASLHTPFDITLLPDGSLAITDYAENVVLVAR